MFTLTQNAERWFHFPFCKRDEIWKEAYSTLLLICHLVIHRSLLSGIPFHWRKCGLKTGMHCEAHRVTFVRKQEEERTIAQLSAQANHFLCSSQWKQASIISSVETNRSKIQKLKKRTRILLSFHECLAEIPNAHRGLKQSLFDILLPIGLCHFV